MTSPPYIFTTQNLSDTHHWVSTTNLASNESSVIAKKVFGNWSQGVLTPERQLEIGRWFGKIESTFYNHPKSPHRDIFRVSNDEAEGWVTAVWPDLAKISPLGQILKKIGPFLEQLYSIWQNCEPANILYFWANVLNGLLLKHGEWDDEISKTKLNTLFKKLTRTQQLLNFFKANHFIHEIFWWDINEQ